MARARATIRADVALLYSLALEVGVDCMMNFDRFIWNSFFCKKSTIRNSRVSYSDDFAIAILNALDTVNSLDGVDGEINDIESRASRAVVDISLK